MKKQYFGDIRYQFKYDLILDIMNRFSRLRLKQEGVLASSTHGNPHILIHLHLFEELVKGARAPDKS